MPPSPSNKFFAGLPAVALALAFCCALFFALTYTLALPDLFGCFNFGRLFLETGSLPTADPFSYLPTNQPWIFHEWLSGILFYAVRTEFGDAPLQLIKYACGFLSALFLFLAARQKDASIYTALLGLFLALPALALGAAPVLPRIFTGFFFSLVLLLLARADRHPGTRWVWALPPVFCLWANLHGAFAGGLVLAGLYLAAQGRPGRRVALALALGAAATLINPYGPGLWRAVAAHAASPDPDIWEWMSLPQALSRFGWTRESSTYLVLALAALPALGWLAIRDRGPGAVLLATGILGFTSLRHIPLFGLALAALAPPAYTHLYRTLKSRPKGRLRSRVAAGLLILLAEYAVLGLAADRAVRVFYGGNPMTLSTPWGPGIWEYYYPEGAVHFIRENGLSGNILSEMVWGTRLSWELYPAVRVALDTRTESVFPETVRRQYFDFYWLRPRGREFLDAYPHQMILLARGTPLWNKVAGLPGWREIYQDRSTALYLREALPEAQN